MLECAQQLLIHLLLAPCKHHAPHLRSSHQLPTTNNYKALSQYSDIQNPPSPTIPLLQLHRELWISTQSSQTDISSAPSTMAQVVFNVPRGAGPNVVYAQQMAIAKMRHNTALKAVHDDERLLEWILKHHNEVCRFESTRNYSENDT
jgi:hypothetical protein